MRRMKRRGYLFKANMTVFVLSGLFLAAAMAWAYPPGVGITSKSRSCLDCHADSGPWRDDTQLIIDILDAKSRVSTRQPDGSFLINAVRGQKRALLTVIGRDASDSVPPPERNGWTYVDTTQIASSSMSKFAPGWDVDLPMSCKAVGDTIHSYAGDHVTVVPINVRPGDAAQTGEIELQVLLTTGDPVKGKPKEGLVSNYFRRRVRLQVTE